MYVNIMQGDTEVHWKGTRSILKNLGNLLRASRNFRDCWNFRDFREFQDLRDFPRISGGKLSGFFPVSGCNRL